MRRKDKEQPGATEVGSTAPSTASAMMTPLDIQQKEFQVSRLGGYRMRDVDEFLDQLTDAMTAVLAENERLRSGASGSPIVGSPDLDEVSRQADEIIQRARDEAARIVADANERAASMAGHAASGSVQRGRSRGGRRLPRSRAGVPAEPRRARAGARRRGEGDGPGDPPAEPQPSAGAGPAEQRTGEAAPPARRAQRLRRLPARRSARPRTGRAPSSPTRSRWSATPRLRAQSAEAARPEPVRVRARPRTGADPPDRADPTADEPIVVSEPEPARARRDDDEGGDESLRELFWGEEG